VRKIVLLTVAGLASAGASWFGVAAWLSAGPGAEHTRLFAAYCIFPSMSLVAFLAWFVMPRVSLVMAWVILTGSYITAYLVPLEACARHACTTQDSLRIGWETVTGAHQVWMLAAAALCLLFEYTAPARHDATAVTGAEGDGR
jgi:hypothetical protein